MLKVKKILSVILAVAMLCSFATLGASAQLGEGKTLGLILTSDKSEKEIVQGTTVTVTMRFEMADFSQLMSGMRLAILYDASVYTPDLNSMQMLNDFAGYFKTTKPTSNAKFGQAVMDVSTLSAEDKAMYTGAVMQQFAADTTLGVTINSGYTLTEDADGVSLPEYAVTFNVTGDPSAGNKNIIICDGFTATAQYIKTATGTSSKNIDASLLTLEKASIATNWTSEATPVVAKAKSQVLFTGDKATGTPDDAFAYRLTSVVTADDLALMNTKGNSITELGFVAANASNAGTLAEAKAAVETGTQLPAGWKTANTTYISQADATADAYFGARIQNILHSTQAEDISVCAYVAYTDGRTTSYIWYDAAVTAGVSTNYDSAVAAWAKL